MPIQPEPILRGAVRWLERIPASGISRARSLLVTNPRLADLTPTQYETSLNWLSRTGLLSAESPAPASVQVFEQAVREAVWFADADIVVRSSDELPADAIDAALAVELDEGAALRVIRAAWGKVDTERRERVGFAGEVKFVELLRGAVVGEVEHVSTWSDGLGYDVAIQSPQLSLHIEVKSTTRRGRLAIHLSRNEFEVMRTDPQWVLVAVTMSADLEAIEQVCEVRTSFLDGAAPHDQGRGAHWESCRFDVPSNATIPGVPNLLAIVRDVPEARLITGDKNKPL